MRTSRWRSGSLVVLALLLAAPAAVGAEEELGWSDGPREGKQSSDGTGHVVSFEAPKGKWFVRAVRIHGKRFGGGYDAKTTTFRVSICDGRMVPISSVDVPYIHFPPGRWKWVDVNLPHLVRVPRDFTVCVSFDPTRDKGVFVGWTKPGTSHSAYGLPGGETKPAEDKEWMIRAVLCKKPRKDVVKEMMLAYDTGERTGQESVTGSGHVIEATRPAGTWWIQSILVHGQRYGGDYDPRLTRFRVSVADANMRELTGSKARYSLFGREWSWVEIPFGEPIEAPKRFRIAVDFDPASTHGINVGISPTDGRGHSMRGKVGRKAVDLDEGEWMIRVRLVSEKPEPPAEGSLASDPEVYKQDFEFLKKTVAESFPALEKKGVDWGAVCEVWEKRFAEAKDDAAHILNAHRLLALLGDMQTGVSETDIPVEVPTFEGLYGAGMWIAREGDHLILRALMDGHALEKELGHGALLLSVDGVPAPIVHERVRRRLKTWLGWSSDHYLDARLSHQFFPFGDKKTVRARFLNPDGNVHEADLERWGPGEKGLSRQAVTVPSGVEAKGLVASSKLAVDVGYLRILGGMNEATKKEFFDHMSRLKGVAGIVLDCRGMGGGGDPSAWQMAGRFFSRKIKLKHDPELKPSGDWQFDGPLVMLTDEREVSSAETFTWALAETKRAVTVGRPTGGATMVPQSFTVPSGLFQFRLGCRDRETSVYGVQPEGVGTKPDIFVCYNAALLQAVHDPVLAAGYDIAKLMLRGASRSTIVGAYGGVLGVDPVRLQRALPEWKTTVMAEGLRFDDLTGVLVDRMVWWAVESVRNEANRMPDIVADGRTLDRYARMARLCGREKMAKVADEAAAKLMKERNAQLAWHEMLKRGFPPTDKAIEDYVAAHGGTRWAETVGQSFK